MNKLTTNQKREVRGIVFAVEFTDNEGKLLTPENDDVEQVFIDEGFDVQGSKLGIDGYFLVEVRLL